jgi:hypothetical protein
MRDLSAGGRRSARRAMSPRVVLLMAAIYLAALAALWSVAASSTNAEVSAYAARTISVNDTGQLHLTSHHGFVLNLQGTASGTVRGTLYIHLDVASTNHVTAEVNIYPSGSSVTGNASAAYHVHGSTASFNGTMNVTRGTGSYNHAHGNDLSFTGTIQRSNDATSVQVKGSMTT